MEGYCIILITFFGSCFCEWVLLPSIYPKQNQLNQFLDQSDHEFLSKNHSYSRKEICPDFHNLTTMSYGTMFKDEMGSRNGWEISLTDVEEILRENEKLPKLLKEKVNLIKQIEDDFMIEAEHQIKTLFSPSREARTKHFYSPSMESALLTISMLLFGVFLSKLILKLCTLTLKKGNRSACSLVPETFTQSLQSIQWRNIHDDWNPSTDHFDPWTNEKINTNSKNLFNAFN